MSRAPRLCSTLVFVAVTLARRLLNESYEFAFEDAVGHFLAAQHRSISQTAFLDTLKKEQEG